MDAFHCRGLKRILGIPCSYVSRVNNGGPEKSAQPLSNVLASRQITLYNKNANSSDGSLVREVLCKPGGAPRNWATKRRRGRPRQQWATENV